MNFNKKFWTMTLSAAMAASHTWPSSISPSPSRAYTR